MLTPEELAEMRQDEAQAYPDTCTIATKSEVSDGMGGTTESYVPTYTGVPCFLSGVMSAGKKQEEIVASILEGRQGWYVGVPYNQPVALTDRIIVLGHALEVVLATIPQSWELTRRVLCVEVV